MARTKHFTVSAGRQIYCDGRPFISVGREGETRPTTADALTHKFARDLNRSKITCDTRLDYEDFLGGGFLEKLFGKKKPKRHPMSKRIYFVPGAGKDPMHRRGELVTMGRARRRKRRRR